MINEDYCEVMTAQVIIDKAKENYPCSYWYKGKLSEEEYSEISEKCDIHCSSAYMDGSATLSIRYKC